MRVKWAGEGARLASLLAGTAILTLWRLGRLPLLDVDEPVYGEVGKRMALAHGAAAWLTPHYNGALWFDKPPLFYWLVGLCMRAGGATEWMARLPSALCAVGLVWLTYALVTRMFPLVRGAGLWSGFVLATSVQFFLLARACVTDMTLTLCLAGALLGLWTWLDEGKARAIASCGAWTGLACLAKGPVALVLVGAQLLLYVGAGRRWGLLRAGAVWAGLLLCLCVALPWYALMIAQHRDAFVQGFLEANNVTRFLKPEHHETNAVWWYVPIFAAFFCPWTLAVPGALKASRARNIGEKSAAHADAPRPTLFLGLWCSIVFLFFSASQTKLVTYIFPLFPAMAALVGVWIAEGLAHKTNAWPVLERLYAGVFAALAVLLTVVGRQYHAAPVTLWGWGIALAVTACACVLWRDGRGRRLAPGLGVAATLLLAWLSPTWNGRAGELSERVPAQVAARGAPLGQPLYAMALKHTSLVFYSGRRVTLTDSRTDTIADMAAHPDHVWVMKTRDFDDMRRRYKWSAYRLLFQSKTTCVMTGLPSSS